MDQCNQGGEVLEIDERFKKLQRSLKLTLLKNLHNKNVDNKLSSATNWSNISSINGDSLNASYLNSPLNTMSYAPSIKSEILTSSNNFKNKNLTKKHYNTNDKKMTTSSVKQYNVNQDKFDQFVMPPPVESKVYSMARKHEDRIHTLSNGNSAVSTPLDASVQFSSPNILCMKNSSSCVSANTNISEDYPQSYVASMISANNIQTVRVFSRWKVVLNNQYELLIKGTLECGKIAHSKPIVRRYTATCIESKFRHKYHLQGNIVDETSGLPDYVREKFYNGFPDDWENVYQIWKTYINQGCPITFRWPTPITDSDDDLKSEMTDLTYTRVSNDRIVSKIKSYGPAEHIQSEHLDNNKSPNKKEKCHNCSANKSQNYERNASFTKSFIPDLKNDTEPIAQMTNSNLAYDENNEENFRSNIKTLLHSLKIKLMDYIQEDKLNIIIDNLVDKNCPQTYIDKIIKMFDCLNYVASYRTPSEGYGSIILTSQDTSSKSEPIPIQQIIMHDNRVNNIENRTTELKSYAHSTTGYEDIKNNFVTIHQSNVKSIEPEHNDNKDLDKLESEIYAGIPKISIERVLRHKERIYKRPARKKIIRQQYAVNTQDNGVESESVQTTISITNAKETLLSESDTSTRNKATNMNGHKVVVLQRPQRQETTFSINPDLLRNNIDTHGIAKKWQTHSKVVSDVDYTINSDIEVITVDTNMQQANRNPKPDIYLDYEDVLSNKSNNNVPEKLPDVPPRLHGGFIRQPESEIAMKKSKPIITSSIPVNLNLKVNNMDLKLVQSHNSDVIVKEDEQRANIRSSNKVHAKELHAKVPSTKSGIIANDFHFKIAIDNKKETHPKKNSTKSIMNSATEQSNSDKLKTHPKVLIAWTPKVVHYAKSTYKLGLIFQGKLLNEAGHVTNRNFKTDVILKRLSETLIETVNHEFYELHGHLSDNKHNVPKKLAIQCRNGCPADIKQFCLTWETLQNDNLHEDNASMDLLKAPVSSRGRKIVPPLCYWEGERISLKDDNPVYNPGSSLESLISLKENSNEASSPKVETTKKPYNSKKSTVSSKRRIAQQLTYSSSDSEDEENVSLRKRLRNSQPKMYVDAESLKNRLRRQTFSLRSKENN